MTNSFSILIADRNPHISKFLKRELEAEGYRVQVAKDGPEILTIINIDDSPDLLILDPDMPSVDGSLILETIRDRLPTLAIIIHTLHPEDEDQSITQSTYSFLEKQGNTDYLKKEIKKVLRNSYPDRFSQ